MLDPGDETELARRFAAAANESRARAPLNAALARIVAEHADIWHGFGDVETFAHKNTVLDEWCAKVGRDPAEIERSIGVNPKHIDQADGWLEAGADEFTLGVNGPDYDLGVVKDWLAWRDSKNA